MAAEGLTDLDSVLDDLTSLDGDSAFEASMSEQTDSSSIATSIKNYRLENGRTYHTYGKAKYYGPNDEKEQDHLDVAHHFFTLFHDGKLQHTPVESVNRVLDLGTGTGIWCIDFADEHPEADVKGIDISPIQPSYVPPNCKFEVDDFNLEFLDDDKFDLIHARSLNGCVLDGKEFYQKIFYALAPGGWFDGSEFGVEDYHSASNNDKMFMDVAPKSHPLYGNMSVLREASQQNGTDIDIAPKVEGWLKEAGFVNIKVDKRKVPIGAWSKDKKQKELGAWNMLRLETGLEGYFMRLLTSFLGWSFQEVIVYTAGIRAGYREASWQLWIYLYLFSAQRPADALSTEETKP